MSESRFTRFTWAVLATNLAVILWGAFVRATGSGAGCGNNWPTCNGEIIPRSPSVETLIELTHRLTSGIALILVVVLAVWARRLYGSGHRVRRAAAWTLGFMLGEAAIGAGIVLFELVADNESMARALFMAVHLGNTFFLLAANTVTAYWAGGGPSIELRGHGHRLRLVVASLVGTLLIGISGAVAALGDTLFPATSLGEAIQQDLSPTSHVLIQLRISHPVIAVLVSLLLLHFIATLRKTRGQPTVRRYANRLNLLIFVQVTAGAVNIILLAPVWMQLLHLLLADLLWITLVLTCAACLAVTEAAPAASARPRSPRTEPTAVEA
ncbi:MAG: COX15/CtaA family protein [Acidobacteriota bacterium]